MAKLNEILFRDNGQFELFPEDLYIFALSLTTHKLILLSKVYPEQGERIKKIRCEAYRCMRYLRHVQRYQERKEQQERERQVRFRSC